MALYSTIWEWLCCAGAPDIVEVEVEVELEVIGLIWLPLEREIPHVIVLTAFIEKDSFLVICEIFDMCLFEELFIVILIGIKLRNK